MDDDEFVTLTGLKPQGGKSSPMKQPPSTTSFSNISDFDYDTLFSSNNNKNDQTKYDTTQTSHNTPLNYDKPLYDDYAFASLSPSGRSDEFDDLFGSLGGNVTRKQEDGTAHSGRGGDLDDLLPGFGTASPAMPSSSSRWNSDPSPTSTGNTKDKSNAVDDPFVVLESMSTPGASSKGLFEDPLEEISKLSKPRSTKAGVSSASGDVFGDIDSLIGLGKPVPTFLKETNSRVKSQSPSEEGSSMGSGRSSVSREPIEESFFGYSDSQSQKMPFDDFQESHQTVRNSRISFDQATSPTSHSETSFHVGTSPKSEEYVQHADDIWLSVSEIPLFTPITKAPPPSRPPPPIPTRASKSERASFVSNSRTLDDDFSSSFNSAKYSQNANASFTSIKRNKESVNVRRDEQVMDEEREREEKEREQRKLEKERNREIEREKARQAVERANREARERAAAEARLKAERAAVQRAQNEARERAAAEANKRAEKAAAEARERASAEKAAAESREKEALEKAAVAKAQAEARRRAERAAEARLKAERAAVQRAQNEARERAAAEANKRAEKAAAEARERVSAEKAAAESREKEALEKAAVAKAQAEARRRAERAAVERVTAEARERATAEARERAAAAKMNQQKNENDLDSFFSMGSSASSAPKPSTTANDPAADPLSQVRRGPEGAQRSSFKTGAPPNARKASPTTNFVDDLNSIFESTPVADFQDVDGESEERRRARLERQQRTDERAAKALAEKNQRDLQNQKEQEERQRVSVTLDAEIKRWVAGKEGNLRSMLSSLQYVLWPECGWQPISLTDLITGASVKKAYRKATLCIHPDKVQQKGATIQQKYVAEKVFDLLKEAWNKFNSEELF